MLDYAAESWKGARDYQEDGFGVLDLGVKSESSRTTVYLIADGMGGHAGGAVASAAVVRAFLSTYAQTTERGKDPLEASLEASTEALAACEAGDDLLRGLGSTLIATVVTDAGVNWLSVGDSPFWLAREGKLHRLNADHSMKPVLERMAESGEITQEEADHDPKRHQLRSALTKSPPDLVDRSENATPLKPGDVLVLASDGVLTLTEEQIVSHCSPAQSASEICRRIMDDVKHRATNSQDNTTVVVLRFPGATAAAAQSRKAPAAEAAAPAPTQPARAAAPAQPVHDAAPTPRTPAPTTPAASRTGLMAGLGVAAVAIPLVTWLVLRPSSTDSAKSTIASPAVVAAKAPTPALPPSSRPVPSPSPAPVDHADPIGTKGGDDVIPPGTEPPGTDHWGSGTPLGTPTPAPGAPPPGAANTAPSAPTPSAPAVKPPAVANTATPPIVVASSEPSAEAAPSRAQEKPSAPVAATPPPAPTPPQDAVLVVESSPPGADVYVDGALAGKAGESLKVKPGPHAVRVEKAGHIPADPDRQLKFVAGETQKPRFNLLLAHARKGCHEGKVYWFDSSDRLADLDRACGAGEECVGDGKCQAAAVATPVVRSPIPPPPPTQAPVAPAPAAKAVAAAPAAEACGDKKAQRICAPDKGRDIFFADECNNPNEVAESCRGIQKCKTIGGTGKPVCK